MPGQAGHDEKSGFRAAFLLIQLEYCHEGGLGNFHLADLAHALLAGLLLLEQLALTGDVAAVAFSRHVLAHLAHGFARDDLGADGGLDGDVELLARDQLLELLANLTAELVGVVLVNEGRQRVGRLAVEQYVQLHQAGRPESGQVIIK